MDRHASRLLAELAAHVGGEVQGDGAVRIDARTLLDTDDFADAQHPSPAGRTKLSEFIGSKLPSPPRTN